MTRKVAFHKAIGAGATGAVAWEFSIRILVVAGVPAGDIVRFLGTMIDQDGTGYWWPIGLMLHCLVGAIWAVFYAYFFWSEFDWPAPIQGLVFSILPALLAGLVMMPQMEAMHPLVQQGIMPSGGVFGAQADWGMAAGSIIGHLIYGLTLGFLYHHPVGYRADRKISYA